MVKDKSGILFKYFKTENGDLYTLVGRSEENNYVGCKNKKYIIFFSTMRMHYKVKRYY